MISWLKQNDNCHIKRRKKTLMFEYITNTISLVVSFVVKVFNSCRFVKKKTFLRNESRPGKCKTGIGSGQSQSSSTTLFFWRNYLEFRNKFGDMFTGGSGVQTTALFRFVLVSEKNLSWFLRKIFHKKMFSLCLELQTGRYLCVVSDFLYYLD